MTEHPIHNLAMDIRYDLTAAQGKLTELMRQVGELELPAPPAGSFINGPVTAQHCPDCGVGGNIHAYDCQAFHVQVSAEVGQRLIAERDAALERTADDAVRRELAPSSAARACNPCPDKQP